MSDYLMRMIDQISEMARNIFDKSEDNGIHMVSDQTDSLDTLTGFLFDCLDRQMFNEGENALFSYAEKDHSAYVFYAGKMFYSKLSDLSEETLQLGNFSREEIYQGLRDFSELFQPDSVDNPKVSA